MTKATDYTTAIAWTAFLVLLTACGWYKAIENQRDWDRQIAWQTRMATLSELSRVEFRRTKDFLQSVQGKLLSLKDVERELNNGEPFSLRQVDDRQVAEWMHPAYGIPAVLSIEDQKLMGWNMSGGSPMQLLGNAQPMQIRYNSQAEQFRKAVRPMAVIIWVAAAVLASIRSRYSWVAAQSMLASAMTYGAATVVAPNYNLTFQGIFSNDSMFYAVIMYAISLAAMAWRWPSRDWKPQFQLKHLLVATTASALLLAMGSFGYFALSVFAGGALILWLMLWKMQGSTA